MRPRSCLYSFFHQHILLQAPITPRGLALLQPLLDPQDSGLVDVNSLYSDLLAHQRWLTLGKGMSREAEVCGNCGLRLPQPPLDPSPRCGLYPQLLMSHFVVHV